MSNTGNGAKNGKELLKLRLGMLREMRKTMKHCLHNALAHTRCGLKTLDASAVDPSPRKGDG
ncbi:hypothetical protein PanWU01x14_192610 [Parasponia andersonii]|uniref:Uncharacterized protein n=1 Tax=Parasponia andersonii TaxID=3476 RepID=A0A2P5C174_PARAD|nr:hypothetical protein PanWU01x14_192610 [Parasponia andersonii]